MGKLKIRHGSTLVFAVAPLALALSTSTVIAQSDAPDAAEGGGILEEVIVSAQKREQTLMEVPLAVSAIGQVDIEASGINSMSDFFRRVPSMAVIDQGAARKNIIIRGVQTNTSTEASVTDVYLDEQRITSAIATADPRTFDLKRVEVLRGPQGTLFGGGSLAGTLRYITNRPNVSAFETNVAASLSSTSDASGSNYSFDGMVNIPLVEDTFGLRLVAYTHEDSGYLKNTLLGMKEVADITSSGARVLMQWVPSDNVTVDYKYVLQDLEQNGFPEARGIDVKALDQASATLTKESLVNDWSLHDLTINWDLGIGMLTSSTGYLQMDFIRKNDVSLPLIRDFFEDYELTAAEALATAPEELRLWINDDNDNYTFTQELRLVSSLDEDDNFAWIVGAYYEKGEEDVHVGDFLAPGGGELLGTANYQGAPADFFWNEQFTTFLEQKAVFGEFTYFFTDQFQGTIGYRHSDFESYFEALAYVGDEPDENGDALIDELATDPFTEKFDTLKLNLSYDLDDNSMLFLQSAEGFRLGFGSEVPPPLNPGCETFVQDFLEENGLGDYLGPDGQLPGTDSDSLWMHEVGYKRTSASGRASFSAGVFYGDWEDIQVDVEIDDITGKCNTGFTANAASATSKGFELEFNLAVTEQFFLSGSGSYVDATVDKDEPFLGASAGERLPGSPDIQLSLTGDYVWPLQNGNSVFLRGDVQYIGEILGAFEFGDERTSSGKYALGNLRVGYETEKFTYSAFVNNLTDERGKVFSNGLENEFRRTIILRPRTMGLEFRTKF
ncbi:MAG: TonB-dependent receptor [Gammaproteobacteria bacterium]|nr:TonB-dependent receptor [Gammaproteobacteria bacterium]